MYRQAMYPVSSANMDYLVDPFWTGKLLLIKVSNRFISAAGIVGSCWEKSCLRGFRQSEIQTSFVSYRDELEN